MSRDDARWADELLVGARAHAEPRPTDAARNFAAIEARLGGVGGSPDADAGLSPDESAVLTLPQMQVSPAARPATLAPARGLPALAKAGLVLTFGFGTGLVGYWMGRADAEPVPDAATHDPVAAGAHGMSSGPRLGALAPSMTLDEQVTTSAAEAMAAPDVGARSSPSNAVPAASGPRAAEPRRTPERARPSPAPARPRAVDAAEPPFGLRDALELLRHAEAALRRSDGLEARMWLGDLDRRAPPGLLLEERLVSETLAHCALGDVSQARETLRRLLGQNSESIYRARLEGSCVADGLRRP